MTASPVSQTNEPLTDAVTLCNVPIDGSNRSNGVLLKVRSKGPAEIVTLKLEPAELPRPKEAWSPRRRPKSLKRMHAFYFSPDCALDVSRSSSLLILIILARINRHVMRGVSAPTLC